MLLGTLFLFVKITFFSKRTSFTLWFSSNTLVSSEKNESIMKHSMVFFGETGAYFFVCFKWIFCFHESESIEDYMDVGVYSYIWSIKCYCKKYFGSFDSYSWELGKFFNSFWRNRVILIF